MRGHLLFKYVYCLLLSIILNAFYCVSERKIKLMYTQYAGHDLLELQLWWLLTSSPGQAE